MSDIESFEFRKGNLDKIRDYKYGRNWPVVYIIEDGKEMYIGETISAFSRSKQHLDSAIRAKLKNIHIISDGEFNKSAALDIESWLIQYMSAEGKFILQNGNGGLKNHEYFDREKYKSKFELIWERLRQLSLATQDLVQLRNTDIFKYSPYKSLSDDQLIVVTDLVKEIRKNERRSYLINGKPGTGKTVLATYLMKYLAESKNTKHLKIGLVVPMTSLRSTLTRVFRKIPGLTARQVIGPADVVKDTYDLLIVDEAHRLKRRVNIPNFGSFDVVNRKLGFDKAGTELDWILASSKQQIFFYDRNQSVRPSDIPEERFSRLDAKFYNLASQLRVEGGEKYINFIDDLLSLRETTYSASDYDFVIYDNIEAMVSDIKKKDSEVGLSRVVAGYAWDWVTRDGAEYDIEIDGLKLVWNSTTSDWVNSKNAVNEVGCIHTIQGYDLNYTGVIIGPEISYDTHAHRIRVDAQKYRDINGRRSADGPEEIERYVINIYKTLLTRGIKGTYVFIVDPELRNLFKSSLT